MDSRHRPYIPARNLASAAVRSRDLEQIAAFDDTIHTLSNGTDKWLNVKKSDLSLPDSRRNVRGSG